MSAIAGPADPDPNYSLKPSGNLRRRMLRQQGVRGGDDRRGGACRRRAVHPRLLRRLSRRQPVSVAFFTAQLRPMAASAAAAASGPAIVGTVEVVLIATVIALPVGVLTAIYLSEFANPRVGKVLTTALEQMAGLPTIICGIFIFGLIVNHTGSRASPPGLALAIVEVPLIARATVESLRRVPGTLREAADALGVANWRTVLGVILPTAANGIVTATILAVARAAGETAPLLLDLERVRAGLPAQSAPRRAHHSGGDPQPPNSGVLVRGRAWRGAPRSS